MDTTLLDNLRMTIEEALVDLHKAPFPEYGGKRMIKEHDAELEWSCVEVSYWYNVRESNNRLDSVDANVIEAVDSLQHALKLLHELEQLVNKGGRYND